LHQINSNANKEFTFLRPSAVLISNDNKPELFVKDDKEILVFDIENNCKFLRKFGAKILRRPYGLAFNTQGNLVLVDADLKNPLVYTFDKSSGKVINAKPYQPVLSSYAQSESLKYTFSSLNNKPLANELEPFDKTKVRFICTNQDYLYASDLGRSIVFKTDLDGNICLAFGHYGQKKRGLLKEPSGLHVDYDGNAILVGDSKNERIQVTKKFQKF
jgi:DNA-binding beta-propeller fold protein YncE